MKLTVVGTQGFGQERIRGEDSSVVIHGLRGIFHSLNKGWGMWFDLSHNSIFRILLLFVEWVACHPGI